MAANPLIRAKALFYGLLLTAPLSQAQELIEELVVIGSRNAEARSAHQSTAPVDLLPGAELRRLGNAADLTDNLRALVPSYNASIASGDGETFVRPTALRGLAPDQSLLLINGKRRHRAALVSEAGPAANKGAHGPSASLIPAISVEAIEVLRDGAAAQYGADAIAGVINLRMKDSAEGGEVALNYGQFYEGEHSFSVAANAGLPLGGTGFANLSLQYLDNEALSRGVQRPDAQALIDAGVAGVGEDSPFGDAPLTHTWGRPETRDVRLFVNSGLPLGGGLQAYAHGNYARTEGRYRFFYRPGDNPLTAANEAHITLQTLGIEQRLPQGFTPYFDGDHTDFSVVAGLKGDWSGDGTYDISVGFGSDRLAFFLSNSINPDLGLGSDGLPPQMNFDVGALKQEELNLNADFTRRLRDWLHLGFGAEWREETFTVIAGEPNSHLGGGPSGFKGLEPVNAGAFSRDNYALYAELEQSFGDRALAQYAVRFERFSDFGSTLNGKLAARLELTDGLAVRGSVSTGFHAPTPGQANLQRIKTTFSNDTGQQVESGAVRPDHPAALALGGAPLEEEQSVNTSLGLVASFGRFALTADLYLIQIDGRIYQTQSLPFTDPATGIGTNFQFFTNALDLESSGVDLVATTRIDWSPNGVATDLSFAFSHNRIEVTGQKAVRGVLPVRPAEVEDIERSYPENRFTLTATTLFGERWDLMARLNFYGRHYAERGRIDGVDGGPPTKRLGATLFADLELGYQLNDRLRITLGAANAFDEYVDRIGPPYAHRLNVGLPYARRTAANFEGGSWYVRLNYQW